MEFHMINGGIDHVCTYRKDDIFMQRQLVQSFTLYGSGGKGLGHIPFCGIFYPKTGFGNKLFQHFWFNSAPACFV